MGRVTTGARVRLRHDALVLRYQVLPSCWPHPSSE
jgi:hypothetical protein